MWVQRKLALNIQRATGSPDQVKDSYKRVSPRISVRTALAALSAIIEFCWDAMSMARNISDRKVGKSRSRRVGRWRGRTDMVPVVGSSTIFWRPESGPVRTIPLAEPGAAIYGRRLGSGGCGLSLMGCRAGLSKHRFTRISSWEKAHSSADRRVVYGVAVGVEDCGSVGVASGPVGTWDWGVGSGDRCWAAG